MTRKRHDTNAVTSQARTTQPGLGSPPVEDEFGFPMPRQHGGERTSGVGSREPPAGATQSRGPEYHPPSAPPPGRGRRDMGKSGTYRVEPRAPTAPRVRPPPLPAPPASRSPAPPQPRAEAAPRVQPPPLPSVQVRQAPEPAARAVQRPSSAHRPPWYGRRGLLWGGVLGLAIGGVGALSLLPVAVRAQGVVTARGAPQSLVAQVGGRVAAVLVEPGDEVGPGSPVVRIHSTELVLELERRRRELAALRSQVSEASEQDEAATIRSVAVLQRRRQLLAKRLAIKDAEHEQRERLVLESSEMLEVGYATPTDVLEQRAQLEATREARLALVDERSQIDIELGDRRSARTARQRERRDRLVSAEQRVRDAESALDVATVEAPSAGWVESLSVVPGSVVQAGAELARLVPRSAPRRVVALVVADEAQSVRAGAEAEVEITALRSSGLGRLPARVSHVSREVARASQVQALLGSPRAEAFVQLELEILDGEAYRAVEDVLRSGSRAVVRLKSSERYLGDVVVDAAREHLTALR